MKIHHYLALAILWSTHAMAADVKGSQDHPQITRFKGAEIQSYDVKNFDESIAIVKPIENESTIPADGLLKLEGKVTRIGYRIASNNSPLEVMRNYEQALAAGHFDTVFKCSGAECGSSGGVTFGGFIANSGKIMPGGFDAAFGDHNRYLLARSRNKDIYVMLYVMDDNSNKRTYVYEQVTELTAMNSGQVSVLDAATMKKDLETQGKVAIYGIYFDTAKADIKPESKPALDEMAKLLTQNPALKVYIVGHTDNVGSLSVNTDLSQHRAEAVVKALSANKVATDRMIAKGVASLAPVESNLSEAGRAKNRRVELVIQ